jgi:hypothetical protein
MAFLVMNIISLFLNFVLGIFVIAKIFTMKGGDVLSGCARNNPGQGPQGCSIGASILMITTVLIFIVTWLSQSCEWPYQLHYIATNPDIACRCIPHHL